MKRGKRENPGTAADVIARLLGQKRAADAWISWVLIMAFAVVLSVFMYNFMVSYTTDQTQEIKKVVYNTDECRQVSLSINAVCVSSQVLNITLQNRNYIRIDGMDFRLYNGHIPIHTNLTTITMNPNREKVITLDIGTATVPTLVEVIPHIKKENIDMICADTKVASAVVSC